MSRTLVWQLALRYLYGKRSANAIPILSRISMTAIAVGCCAMIVLFSVFNGIEGVVKDLYKAFYPEIKITPAKGKFFTLNGQVHSALSDISGISCISHVTEDQVVATSDGEHVMVLSLKGIDNNYFKVNNVKPYIIEGRDSVVTTPQLTAIVGLHIAAQMGIDPDNAFSRISLYYPNTASGNPLLDPASAFVSMVVRPDGVFQIQDEFDARYILAPAGAVQDFLGVRGKVSSIEIKLEDSTRADAIKKQIQNILGDAYRVETRYEQNRTMYMVMHAEKWAMYAILLLVLLIASFNMVGALSLLVLEKQKDMAILKAMGAEKGTIRTIFVLEGLLWSLTGGIIGMIIGTLLCLGQRHFKWIKLQGFLIDAYPVDMQWQDYLLVLVTIVPVGLLAAWYPAARANKVQSPTLRSA